MVLWEGDQVNQSVMVDCISDKLGTNKAAEGTKSNIGTIGAIGRGRPKLSLVDFIGEPLRGYFEHVRDGCEDISEFVGRSHYPIKKR